MKNNMKTLMNYIIVTIIILLVTNEKIFCCYLESAMANYIPPKGLIPDDKTAIKIAKAILNTCYGKSVKIHEVKLVNGIWYISGTKSKGNSSKTLKIEIQQNDCKVINWDHKDKKDCIPNKKTAIAIAEALLAPCYGQKHVNKYKPYEAILSDSIWYLTGSLPFGVDGGTPVLSIQKRDCRVIEFGHEK